MPSLLCLLLIISLAACRGDAAGTSFGTDQRAVQASAEAFARQVVELIAQRRIEALADLVHPYQGVLFSPGGRIEKDAVRLSAGELTKAWISNRQLDWGREEGSGKVIRLPIRDYFKHYVYGADYAKARRVAFNRMLGGGSTASNLQEVFPGASFVEFHFAGFEPQYQGLDWCSLRIVMTPAPSGGWWLLALVNDQWSI